VLETRIFDIFYFVVWYFKNLILFYSSERYFLPRCKVSRILHFSAIFFFIFILCSWVVSSFFFVLFISLLGEKIRHDNYNYRISINSTCFNPSIKVNDESCEGEEESWESFHYELKQRKLTIFCFSSSTLHTHFTNGCQPAKKFPFLERTNHQQTFAFRFLHSISKHRTIE
jgi:hypothetical protein